ncbi:MAG: hypothetical protein Tsb0017_05970 [Geothermobacteraceae bacterium]
MYSRQVRGKTFTFGVSGLLYKSNVLMYDRQTESLWSQIERRAVTGVMSGAGLDVLSSTLTSWRRWLALHPDTLVLTPNTGYSRDYSRDPYEDYYRSRHGLFGLFRGGPGEEAKMLVAGVADSGIELAVPVELLRRQGLWRQTLSGRRVELRLDARDESISATVDGRTVPTVVTYWFVWKDFYPGSRLMKDGETDSAGSL